MKEIIYGDEARNKLKAGVDSLAKAVGTTLGAKGRNVAIEKEYTTPQVINDGVTVAREIELEDKFENMGAQIVKEAASKTNDAAGDGTTTATVLAQAIVESGLRNITAGANPMILRKGIEKASAAVINEIDEGSKDISTKEEKAQIATISSQDEAVGTLISEVMEKVGDNGVMTVTEGRGLDIELTYKEGMQFERGYASPYFVTNQDKMEAELIEPYILVTDQIVDNILKIAPLLEEFVKVAKTLVIISGDISDNMLATLIVNKIQGNLNPLAVKAPHFGDRQRENLEDICAMTGATLISKNTGRELESVTMEDLGRADRVVSTDNDTTIVGGKGVQAGIDKRVKQVKKQLEISTSDFESSKLTERLARLTEGIAEIAVGAATEAEMIEKKLRVEDAINATKAAVSEGIVPGGGIAYLSAREAINDLELEGDEQIGANILFEALERPLRLIVENAGADSGKVLAEIASKKDGIGLDVVSMEYVNMIDEGIIDPARVTKSALTNAVSAAIMVLVTECLVANKEKSE